jgi:membrane peptidoglycan carboxypeptidase
MSEATAKAMREMCYGVVARGTGKAARIEEYQAGGKTGTAQIARENGGGYYADKYTAVFAGFAPISNPRVCAVIVVHDPRGGSHFGGKVCGPIFRDVVRDALRLLECPYEPMPPADPDSGEQDLEDADVLVAHRAAPAFPEDNARGKKSTPVEAVQLAKAPEDQYDEGPRLPDLTGMTKRQVQERLSAIGLAWDGQGSGWVVAQDPPAGAALSDIGHCRVVFSNDRSTISPDTSSTAAPASM